MENILSVNNLKTYYYSKNIVVPAVDGVSFSLQKGETLGIVGESGCGKSTVARSIINLLDKSYTNIEDGEIIFHGEDILNIDRNAMSKIRGKKISMVFQNPLASLNPVFTIGNQIMEVIMIHEGFKKKQAKGRAIELLELVGIPSPKQRFSEYPHQLSGGMQQRVIIAIALACNPEIIIADEPTTALDVTIQAQILELITQVKNEFDMSMILITHNMGIVAEMCNRILVMYGGVVVEEGSTKDIFSSPFHPYTKGLLSAIPSIEETKEELFSIPGFVPKFEHPVNQCRFSSRCSLAFDKCRNCEPPLFNVGDNRWSRCWLYEEENRGNINE